MVKFFEPLIYIRGSSFLQSVISYRYMKKLKFKKCLFCGKKFSNFNTYENAINNTKFKKKYCSLQCSRRSKNTNQYIKKGNITKIITNKGEEIIIDTYNIKLCKQYFWSISVHGYGVCYRQNEGKRIVVFLHHIVFKKPTEKNLLIDHINRNKLDNRVSNLREADYSLNGYNRGIDSNNTSRVRGVSKVKNRNLYHAYIWKSNTRYSGYFKKIEDAVDYRKELEKKYFPGI